jgi:hypothetical protein
MRGVYTVRVQIASLATAKTVLLGTNANSCVLEILEAYITNGGQNTIEQLAAGLYRVSSLGSPTGTSITAANVQKAETGSPNTVVTWLSNITASEPTYDANPMHVEGFTNIAGYRFEPVPEARRFVAPSASFGLRLISSPTNALTNAECLITYRELG